MPKEINGENLYLTSEACEMAGISRGTLFRWMREGVIVDAVRKDRNGWRLFTENEINKIKAEANRMSQERPSKGRGK